MLVRFTKTRIKQFFSNTVETDHYSSNMIVNYTEEGWQIITQRSHGLLAGQICAQWKKDQQPERWVETLIAAAEHDDVYNELENNDLLNENGGPVNFKMTCFNKDKCERLMQMALTKSTYIAVLISRHIKFVHGKTAEAKEFCKTLGKQEKMWMKAAGISAKEADTAYQILQFCDAFSLLICQGMIQPEHRKMEISTGPDNISYNVSAAVGDRLKVYPWPFETDQFIVRYESRTIEQLSFKNVNEFRKVFTSALIVSHELLIKAT